MMSQRLDSTYSTSCEVVEMSRLLINENPLVISPTLVIELGSFEAAAFIQQLHFWLGVSQHQFDGRAWIYNTQEQCVEMMRGTISKSTAKRIVKKLIERNLVEVQQLHTNKWNKTNYFTINYGELANLEQKYSSNPCVSDWVKLNQSSGSDCTNRVDQVEPIEQVKVSQSLQKNTTEENLQNTNDIQFEEFWKTVPNKDGKKTAQTAFKKAIKKVSIEDLVIAYKANVQVCESQNRFKKNPATWLNQECWNDESIQPVIKQLKNPQIEKPHSPPVINLPAKPKGFLGGAK